MTQDEALKTLQSLPEPLRERAVARLKEQGERFQTLKALVEEGLSDAAHDRVSDWNLREFIKELEDEERQNPLSASRQ